MDRYVVLCDCDSGAQPREIAYIDDDRAEGGYIHIEPNVFELEKRQYFRGASVTPNRLGDPNSPVALRCSGSCGKSVSTISDARAGDIVDQFAAIKSELESHPSRPWDAPAKGYEKEYERELLDNYPSPWREGYGDGKKQWRWPADIPRVTHYETRLAIPFGIFRSINSKLPKRRE